MAKADPPSTRPAFAIGGQTVAAGSRKTVHLDLPGLYTSDPVTLSVHVIHGREDGPTLFVSAAVHGDEINGVEIIRRLLRTAGLNRLRGTLLAVPIVNVFGFHNRSRYLPDRRDLNRSFPGSEGGSLAGRLGHTFMTGVVARADIGIDLHTAAIHRDNLAQIRADLTNPSLAPLARAFAAPVLLHSAAPAGSLRAAADEGGTGVMVYEAGEALRFDEASIRVGVRGVVNVLRRLSMLPAEQRATPKPSALLRSSSWVRAPRSGILRAHARLGDAVARDAPIGLVADPDGGREGEILAPFDGIVIGCANLPLVYAGEALFHIGRTRRSALPDEPPGTAQDTEVLAPPELIEEPPVV